MITVVLSPDEFELAAIHGILRRVRAIRAQRSDKTVGKGHSWNHQVEASCAEMAYCKWRGIYWTGLEKFKAKDGGTVEIRWTEHEGTGGLLAYPKDCDDGYIVLVDGRAPEMHIIGYLRGAEAKLPAAWVQKEGKGYYLTPRAVLHPLVIHAIPDE